MTSQQLRPGAAAAESKSSRLSRHHSATFGKLGHSIFPSENVASSAFVRGVPVAALLVKINEGLNTIAAAKANCRTMASDLASKAGCHIFHKKEDHCIDDSSTAFMILATTFVYLQTPAMGICQAGLVRRKNSLSMLMQTLVRVLPTLPAQLPPATCCPCYAPIS